MIVDSAPKPAQRDRLPSSYLAWLGGALTSQLGSAVMLFALTWAATAHGGRVAWAFLVAFVVRLLVGLAPSLPMAVTGAFVTGVGGGVFRSHLTPVLLSAAPESHLARVQAMFSLVQSVSVLVMHTTLGGTAEALGAPTTVVLCAVALALVAVAMITSRGVRHLS